MVTSYLESHYYAGSSAGYDHLLPFLFQQSAQYSPVPWKTARRQFPLRLSSLVLLQMKGAVSSAVGFYRLVRWTAKNNGNDLYCFGCFQGLLTTDSQGNNLCLELRFLINYAYPFPRAVLFIYMRHLCLTSFFKENIFNWCTEQWVL